MKALVVGGQGHVGSVVTEELLPSGCAVVLFDDLIRERGDDESAAKRWVDGSAKHGKGRKPIVVGGHQCARSAARFFQLK